MKRTVFIVYYNLCLGGIQKKIVDIVNWLAEKESDTLIYVLLLQEKFDFDLGWQIKNPQAKIIYCPEWLKLKFLGKKIPFLFPLFIFWQTFRLKPKIIFSIADLPTFAAIWAKLIFFQRKIVVVGSERVYTSWYIIHEKFGGIRSYLIKIFYPFANKIICLTKDSKNDLVKSYSLNSSQIVIVPNWTALAKEKPLKALKDVDLLFMGRLVKIKGVYFFLKAVSEFKKYKKDIKVLIIGNGEEKERIKEFISKNHLEKNVSLINAQYDVKSYLCRSRILVCPSEAKAEGFPTTVLEAMAMKVPIVCRRFAGVEDVIRDGVNGFIADSMDEFIKKINQLLENKILYNRVADQAKKDVIKKHSLDNIKEYLRVGESNNI